MLWKKTSTNYSKWDYYTSSSDDSEDLESKADPVLPKNDPQFQALEKDIEERGKRKKADRQKADAHK